MKISRRHLFGLGAGAAVAPVVAKLAAVMPAPAVGMSVRLPSAYARFDLLSDSLDLRAMTLAEYSETILAPAMAALEANIDNDAQHLAGYRA